MYTPFYHENPDLLEDITLTIPSVTYKGGVRYFRSFTTFLAASLEVERLNHENDKPGRWLIAHDDNPNTGVKSYV